MRTASGEGKMVAWVRVMASCQKAIRIAAVIAGEMNEEVRMKREE